MGHFLAFRGCSLIEGGGFRDVVSMHCTCQSIHLVDTPPCQSRSVAEHARSKKLPLQEQVLWRNVKRSGGGLVFKAHRLVHHSTLGLRIIKQKKKIEKLEDAYASEASHRHDLLFFFITLKPGVE